MNSLKLSKRLLCAASFAREGDFIADVGTDHAYLPIYLYTAGIIRGAVVGDINQGPIDRAKRNIREYSCESAIIPVLSDGLCKMYEFLPDTVFILGMGGELIVNIISKAEWLKERKTRLILQPMTHAEILRAYLFDNGFEILDETLVEDGKIYQIIVAEYTGAKTSVDTLELFFGKINLERADELLVSVLDREQSILGARLEGKRKAGLEGGEDAELFEAVEKYKEKLNEGTRAL